MIRRNTRASSTATYAARAVALTPLAANNIYEQQYQMHRFATENYGAAIGASDSRCWSR